MPSHPTRTASPLLRIEATGWATRLGVSVGMAGFLALMGVLSIPLPWTPVPFSMMPFGLLVAGGFQRPGYAALSVGLYLVAGAVGAPIYADGASGWQHLFGATAGYLWGFLLVSMLVAAYLRRARPLLPFWGAKAAIGVVVAGMVAGVAAIAWTWSTGSGLSDLDGELSGWGVGRSALWFLLFLLATTTALSLWGLARRRGEARRATELFLVMMASLLVLHVCGVTVLWLATPELGLMSALILGSIVFLPFDVLKAGAAVGLTLPFFPSAASPDAAPEHEHA